MEWKLKKLTDLHEDSDKGVEPLSEVLVFFGAAGGLVECVKELNGESADCDDVTDTPKSEGDFHDRMLDDGDWKRS